MRRFSQRNSLVTLNEINITPLLDLAFVLLIIFVITTPLLEQSVNLKLPVGGDAKALNDPANTAVVEGLPDGSFRFRKAPLRGERELEAALVAAFRANPRLVVAVRVEGTGPAQSLVTILDVCRRNGLTRFKLDTEAKPRR
jgi:biopolymer transport protein ExbD